MTNRPKACPKRAPAPKKPARNGCYYYMSCMNAFANGLYPEAEFENDEDAIRTAANYEATLYKYTFHDNKKINSCVLYTPA